MEKRCTIGLKKLSQTTILTGVVLFAAPAFANPQGGSVAAGSASISSSGNTLSVTQNSNKAIINWQGFDIAPGETTQFVQPSASAVTLNRINANTPSQIDGSLKANGNIILINPNGVVFGASSHVDVNSLVVSTSDVDNNDFMNNAKPSFNKPGSATAQIIANGNITVGQAGLVGLVAPHVENNGTITATLGKVQLESGDTFTLDMAGDGITNIAASDAVQQQMVANSGIIQANGGKITLTAAAARNAVDSLVINSGTLEADTFSQQGGDIYLSNSNGTVTNSGIIAARGKGANDQGGNVTIAAQTVHQQGKINVNGRAGGGKVNVSFTKNYDDTANSSISANATTGTGGSIQLNGSAGTALAATGHYSATSLSGNGGNINVNAANIANSGSFSAQGANGGSVTINFTDSYTDSANALLDASATSGTGGTITIEGTGDDAVLSASGTYNANGQTNGGDINMLANNKVLLLGALLNANGANGGGYVRIGGDLHGAGSTRRSQYTYVDGNTIINANAAGNGNGGTVAVWSDVATYFGGTISATGGINGGNGGMVETSGHYLEAVGSVNASAPLGQNGQWLLDPADLTITTSTGVNITSSGSNPITWADNSSATSGSDSYLYAQTIENELSNGTSVIVQTTNTGSGGTGQIIVSSAINVGAGTGNATTSGSLTLSAYSNILVNAAITMGSGSIAGGNLILQSRNAGSIQGYVQVNAAINTYGGNLTIGGGSGTISAGSGYAVGGSGSTNMNGILINAGINAAGGSIIMNGQGGTYSFGGNNGILVGGSVQTSGSGTITFNGTSGTATNTDYGIDIDHHSYSGNVISTGSGAITLNGTGGVANYGMYIDSATIGNTGTSYTGAIQISAGGEGLLTASSNSTPIIQTTNSGIGFSGTTNISGSGPNITTTNNSITIDSTTGDLVLGNISTTGNTSPITLAAISGSITTGSITTGTLVSGISAVNVVALDNISTGAITGKSVLLDARSAGGSTGYIAVSGDVTTAGGAIVMGGGGSPSTSNAIGSNSSGTQYGVYVNGAINAGGGSITLNGQGGQYSGGDNEGVFVSAIQTSGSSAITINGTGGTGGDNNDGVYIAGAVTTSGAGTINITGTASSGTSYGVIVDQYNYSGSVTSTGSGAITITGIGGTDGIYDDSGGLGGSSYSGNLSLITNTIAILGSAYAPAIQTSSSGTITIRPYSAEQMTIGDDVAGTLSLDATATGYLNYYSTGMIIFGDTTNTTTMNINADIFTSPVTFLSAGDVAVNGHIQSSSSSANAVVIDADNGSFINYIGHGQAANAITVTNGGSWVVFSNSLSDDTGGASVMNPATTIYSQSYPTTTGASGNTWIYKTSSGGGTNEGTVTITASSHSDQYGTAESTTGVLNTTYTCTGAGCAYIAGATLAFSGGSGTSGSGNYNVGTWTITATSAWDSGYTGTIDYVNGALTVTAKTLTDSGFAVAGRGYNGGLSATISNNGSLTGVISGDTVSLVSTGATASFGSGNAGVQTATASGYTLGGADAANYSFTQPTASATISQAALTVTATNQTQAYGFGGTAAALGTTGYTVSGTLYGSDGVTGVTLSTNDTKSAGGYYNANSGAGTSNTPSSITPSAAVGSGLGNYSITYTNASTGLTVTQAALSVAGISGTNQTYNGGTNDALSGTATLSGKFAGDNVTLGGTGAGTLGNSGNAGNDSVTISGYTISGSDAANYSFSQPTVANVTIAQEAITITPTSQNLTYGTNTTTLGTGYSVTTGALQGTDTISGLTMNTNDTTSGSGNYNAGTYNLTASAASGTGGFNTSNYAITYATNTGGLVIAQKALTATGLSGTSQAYNGGTSDALTGTAALSGKITGDNVTLTGSGAGTLGNSGYAGNDSVTVSGYGISGSDAGNYSFSQPMVANVTISPQAITIAATNQNQTYGFGGLGTTGYSITSGTLQGSDSVTGVTLSTNAPTSSSGNYDVGTYNITPTAASGSHGFNSTNYTITYTTDTGGLSISPKALTVTANTQTYQYGSTLGTLTYTTSGLVTGDTLSGALTTIDGGAGTVLSHANGFDVASGPYAITQGTLTGGNYAITYNGATLSLTAKALSDPSFAVANKLYDNTAIASITNNGALAGVAAGDNVVLNSNNPTAAFASANPGTQLVTGSGYSISGAQAGNYIFAQPTTFAIINPTSSAVPPTITTPPTSSAPSAPATAPITITSGATATRAAGSSNGNDSNTESTTASIIPVTVLNPAATQGAGGRIPPAAILTPSNGKTITVPDINFSPSILSVISSKTAFVDGDFASALNDLSPHAGNYYANFVNGTLRIPCVTEYDPYTQLPCEPDKPSSDFVENARAISLSYIDMKLNEIGEPENSDQLRNFIIPGVVSFGLLTAGYLLFFKRGFAALLTSAGVVAIKKNLEPSTLLAYWEKETTGKDDVKVKRIFS